MVIDAARGIEPQTRKLYEVCRARRIPIVTFVNKMDHDALDPLELLDHVERTPGIATAPLIWPIGDRPRVSTTCAPSGYCASSALQAVVIARP